MSGWRSCRFPTEFGGRSNETIQDGIKAERVSGAGRAVLELDLTGFDALGPDDQLPGQADEVDGRELRAWPVVAVIVEHAETRGFQLGIEVLASLVGLRIAGLSR